MSEDVKAAVLLVDRDPADGREILSFLADRGYAVEWVDDGEKAFNRLDTRLFDVLVTELNIQRVDGMRLMSVAKDRNPDVCVVFIADHPDIELATEAMRQGAYDFQTKPLNLGKLDAVMQRGHAHQRLVLDQHELRRRLDEMFGLGNLVGNSRQMVKVYNAVRKAAPAKAPVLIQGESGTGKDLIALAIHNNGPRRDDPFVKVQCGGLPDARGSVELFGTAAGGAGPRQGRVELADGGTLYLDEVGDLTPGQQQGILRVIDEQRVQRVGDRRFIAADVRIIGATNRPVHGAPFQGALFQRLQEAIIVAPPLRDRREDIPLLVHHFLREASRSTGAPVAGITRNASDLLARYDWPGNVRELKNIVEGMVVLVKGARPLDVGDVPEQVRRGVAPITNEIRLPVGVAMRDVEKTVIEETLKACAYRKDACAKTLGIGLRTLYRKLKEYDIQ
jgi:DNA-binding NtrC family response regulator